MFFLSSTSVLSYNRFAKEAQRLSVDYNAMRAFVYVLIPLERERCDKMARFEPFSSQERK